MEYNLTTIEAINYLYKNQDKILEDEKGRKLKYEDNEVLITKNNGMFTCLRMSEYNLNKKWGVKVKKSLYSIHTYFNELLTGIEYDYIEDGTDIEEYRYKIIAFLIQKHSHKETGKFKGMEAISCWFYDYENIDVKIIPMYDKNLNPITEESEDK
jgi:hypothetical protein